MLKLANHSRRSISLPSAAILLVLGSLGACASLEPSRLSASPTSRHASAAPPSEPAFWGFSPAQAAQPSGPTFWGFSPAQAAQPTGPTFWGFSTVPAAQPTAATFWGYSVPANQPAPAMPPAREPHAPVAAER